MPKAALKPRRSCLYIPGANSRALEKAKKPNDLAADVLILDLEDAVMPEAKADAREQVAKAVSAGGYGQREVIIRINGLDTAWGKDDLTAAVDANPDGILVPKISTRSQLMELENALHQAGAAETMMLWVMVETPLAILNIQEIAACAETTRLCGFVIGTNDLAKDMTAKPSADRTAFQTALSVSVIAARAYGLCVIDGVFNDISNLQGLETECRQGRVLGFDGKSLIHPTQLETANEIFAPDAKALSHAKDVVAAFNNSENAGKGVLKINGKMTELLHLEEAKNLLAYQEMIDSL